MMNEQWKTIESVPGEVLTALLVPLPKDAIKQHPTKKYLSSIKVIYMVERLNQVFGLNGWFTRDEFIAKEEKHWVNADGEECSARMVVVKVTLEIPRFAITRWAYGGNDNLDLGDAYKGAVTDAISKICGELGIGMDVYKGHGDNPPQAPARKFIPPTPIRAESSRSMPVEPTAAQENQVTVFVQSVNTMTTSPAMKDGKPVPGTGGKPYLMVDYMEGRQKFSLVCFDAKLFDAVKGVNGEKTTFKVERGGKYPKIVGILSETLAETLKESVAQAEAKKQQISDADLPF